jgi:hypothetical protein
MNAVTVFHPVFGFQSHGLVIVHQWQIHLFIQSLVMYFDVLLLILSSVDQKIRLYRDNTQQNYHIQKVIFDNIQVNHYHYDEVRIMKHRVHQHRCHFIIQHQ